VLVHRRGAVNVSKRPIIGVSSRKIHFTHDDRPYPRYGVAIAYVQAIERAGGAPLIIPMSQDEDVLARLLGLCEGLLLTGGQDVDPALYDEEPHRKIGQIDPLRDRTEMFLAKAALARDMPLFGVCRGAQVLNVAAGGSLYQDLEAQREGVTIQHFQNLSEELPSHSVMVEEGTWLRAITGEAKVRVNSYHHQAVKDIAPGFKIAARATDGVIEAIESTRHAFVNGVQWHPELMHEECDFNLGLFRALIEAAARACEPKAVSRFG
jgi:putative glutamine amidotransferase